MNAMRIRLGACLPCVVLCLVACGDETAANDNKDTSTTTDEPGGHDTGGPDDPDPASGPQCDVTVHSASSLNYLEPESADACGFAPDIDLVGVALSPSDYDEAMACGACIEVESAQGSVRAVVYGRCDDCADGDINLGQTSFEHIGSLAAGIVAVDWRFVPCGLDAPVSYYFAPASSAWWLGLQVRGHEHAVAKLEVRPPGGTWVELARADYNYFEAAAGTGTALIDVRITDIYGQQLTDTGVPLTPDAEVPGAAQFTSCTAP